MLRFFLRRFRYSLLVLLGVVTVVFFLFHVMPGDPARLTLGQRTDQASLENVRRELRLDKPLWQRYLLYLEDLSPITLLSEQDSRIGNYDSWCIVRVSQGMYLVIKQPYLGRSYRNKRAVSDLLSDALPGTLLLAISAMTVATIAGIMLGTLAALRKGTWLDTGAIALSVAGISLPSFFAGLIIAYVFGYVLRPITGLNMTGALWEYSSDGARHLALQHLILPSLALGIRPLAIISQLTRSAMLQVLQQDFIRTARAKGLNSRQVIFRHALPNALNPVVTAVSGWLAELLAGSFFVEYIFGWKGVGKMAVDALEKFDFPVVMGTVLLTAFLFVAINLLTDLLYSWLDPRVRLRK